MYRMITSEMLKVMRETNIMDVNIGDLTDLRDITIDSTKPVKEKLQQFSEQVNNVYLNRIDDYIVKVTYADTNLNINDRMRSYMSRMAEINY